MKAPNKKREQKEKVTSSRDKLNKKNEAKLVCFRRRRKGNRSDTRVQQGWRGRAKRERQTKHLTRYPWKKKKRKTCCAALSVVLLHRGEPAREHSRTGNTLYYNKKKGKGEPNEAAEIGCTNAKHKEDQNRQLKIHKKREERDRASYRARVPMCVLPAPLSFSAAQLLSHDSIICSLSHLLSTEQRKKKRDTQT